MRLIMCLSSALWLSNAMAAEVTVLQNGKAFNVAKIKIKKGDTINFKNTEKDITHNVFSLSAKNAFELKTQAPGTSSPVVFKEAGTTEVECAIHPTMKLTVEVE